MGKQKRKTKMLSFTEKDFDVHEFLMELSNASEYVIGLIRRDMNDRDMDDKYGCILQELHEIKDLLKNGEFKVSTNVQGGNQIDPYLKDKMKQALDIFFDDED